MNPRVYRAAQRRIREIRAPSRSRGGAGCPAPAGAQGPSEYTRVIMGMSMPAPTPSSGGAALPPPAPDASTPAAPSYLPLVIGLSVVLVLAAALVLYFALK